MFIPFWGLAYDNRSILSTNFYVNPENKIKNQQSLEDGSKIHFQNLIYTTLNIPQSIHKYTFGAANEKLPNFQSDGQVRLWNWFEWICTTVVAEYRGVIGEGKVVPVLN